MDLVISGSVIHFDVVLLWKFTNHDDFALTVRRVPLVCLCFTSSVRLTGSYTEYKPLRTETG